MGLKHLKNAINSINQAIHLRKENAKCKSNKVVVRLFDLLKNEGYINFTPLNQDELEITVDKKLNKILVLDPMLYPQKYKNLVSLNEFYNGYRGKLIFTSPEKGISFFDPKVKVGGKVICYVY